MPATPSHLPHAPALPSALAERMIALPDEAATDAFGARFAAALEAARIELARQHAFDGLQIQLIGDLGAGKTTLVRAILRGLGHRGRVRSPTYTLVEPYAFERDDGELEVYHFDLYRFNDPAEWSDAGFREYFNSSAICLVEWPQQAGTLLGIPDLVFSLDVDGDGRALTVRAYSAAGNTCLERC